MKIVIIAPDLAGRSGWSRYALDLGRELAEQGHSVSAIVARKAGADWCTEYAVLRHPTAYQGSRLLCFFHARKLRSLLRTINPDVVHVIAEPYALMLPFMGKQSWKTVMTIHGSYAVVPLMIGRSIGRLFSTTYHLLDCIISVSEFTKNYVKTRAPELFASAGLKEKIIVLHNAINLEGIEATTSAKSHTPLRVLSVSAVKRKKGYLQAIDAIDCFQKKHGVPIQYDIVGTLDTASEFMDDLRHRIQELGLEDAVYLHGEVDDATLDALYQQADLFLLPSLHDGDYFEGFGLVFLEANARGVPVIGPNTGGCPEAINNGLSGYVCDPYDRTALADRMADILLHHTIKRSACRTWAEAHNVHNSAKELAALYGKL